MQAAVTGTKAPERLATSAADFFQGIGSWGGREDQRSSRRILVATPLGGAANSGPNELRVVLGWGEELKARVPIDGAPR